MGDKGLHPFYDTVKVYTMESNDTGFFTIRLYMQPVNNGKLFLTAVYNGRGNITFEYYTEIKEALKEYDKLVEYYSKVGP